jgi:hypothetical protein
MFFSFSLGKQKPIEIIQIDKIKKNDSDKKNIDN